ncbi:hypothetical protein PYCC9005_001864 [Savitreella phatthalungensis]
MLRRPPTRIELTPSDLHDYVDRRDQQRAAAMAARPGTGISGGSSSGGGGNVRGKSDEYDSERLGSGSEAASMGGTEVGRRGPAIYGPTPDNLDSNEAAVRAAVERAQAAESGHETREARMRKTREQRLGLE